MELLLVLILVALIIIIIKLSKISKTNKARNENIGTFDEKISEKIKTSELLLGITYSNFKKIHDQIISNNIDVDYLKDDINFNKVDFGELNGEIAMFKDLEQGELDTTDFPGNDMNTIYNKLFLIFHHLKHDKRKLVAERMLKNKNLPE